MLQTNLGRASKFRSRILPIALFLTVAAWAAPTQAVELKVSRIALERTLKQQLFSGANGRYYLKGDAKSPCWVYASDPELSFVADRVRVKLKTHARLGTSVIGKCVGIGLSPAAEVSLVPDAEGETIGFRDARIERVSDSKELNFFLLPFLRNQVPSSLKVNAADVLRKALEGSTLTTGYRLSLERLKIHSMVIHGDFLILDVDGDMSVQ